MENLEQITPELHTPENVMTQNSENIIHIPNQSNVNSTPSLPRRLSFFEQYFLIRPELYIGRLSYFLRVFTIVILALVTTTIYMLLVVEKIVPFSHNNEILMVALITSMLSLLYTLPLGLKLLGFTWILSIIILSFKRINNIFGIELKLGKILKWILIIPIILYAGKLLLVLTFPVDTMNFLTIPKGIIIIFPVIYLIIYIFLFFKKGNEHIDKQIFDTRFSFLILLKHILLFIVLCPLCAYGFIYIGDKLSNNSMIQNASSKISQVQIQESSKLLLESYGITENNLGKYKSKFEGMSYLYFINALDEFSIAYINSEIQQNRKDDTQKDEILLKIIKSKVETYNFYKTKFDSAMKKSADENYIITTDIQSIPVMGFVDKACSKNSNNEVHEAVIVSSKNQRLSCGLMLKEGYNYVTTCTEYFQNSNGNFDVINYGQGDYGFATFGVPMGVNKNDKSNRYVIQGVTKIGTVRTEGALIPTGNLYYLDLLEKKIKDVPLKNVLKMNGEGERILYFIDNDTVAIGKREQLPTDGEKEITSFGCFEDGRKIPYYSPKKKYKYTETAEYNITMGVRTEK